MKALSEYRKIGRITAFALADRMTGELTDDAWIAKWIHVIGRVREGDHSMDNALRTTGAQNLNHTKITRVLEQVNR